MGLILLFLAWTGEAFAEDAIGRVTRATGSVMVVRAASLAPLAVGDGLFTADRVRTAAEAKVEMTLDGGIVVTVGPDSDLLIARFVQVGGRGRVDALFRLVGGFARSLLGDHDKVDRLAVETATAVASARSTEFIVEYVARKTGVLGVQGVVGVESRFGGAVDIGPGQGTDIATGKAPTPPKTWGQKRADALSARTSFP